MRAGPVTAAGMPTSQRGVTSGIAVRRVACSRVGVVAVHSKVCRCQAARAVERSGWWNSTWRCAATSARCVRSLGPDAWAR